MIIAFEGIDATGKTTLIKQIKTHYEKTRPVHIYQFPYGEQKWQDIINLCKNTWEYPIRAAVYLTAVSEIRIKAQSHPDTHLVLIDRWDWSTYAYAPPWLTGEGVSRTATIVATAVETLNGLVRYTPNRYILLTRDPEKPLREISQDPLEQKTNKEWAIIQNRYEEIFQNYTQSQKLYDWKALKIDVQDRPFEENLRKCIEAIDPLLEYADEMER